MFSLHLTALLLMFPEFIKQLKNIFPFPGKFNLLVIFARKII